MATILLSAAGAAIGGGFGGSVLGLSGAVIGRAVGATLGRVLDQRLLGSGSRAIETGRVDRFRLSGASEGAAVGQVWGRMRIAGQVIWASRFQETVTKSGGGKGAPKPRTTSYSYTVSLAVALCEGPIARVGRIWADGVEIARDDLTMRVYAGTASQLPDAKIEAVEGPGMAPAYRGTAYVVIEDLDLGRFGNRVPQFSFEVMRAAQSGDNGAIPDLAQGVRGVALIPGTGEYALATTPVHRSKGPGENVSVNINTPSGKTDFATAIDALREELPACGSVSLVVSWFGDDLRAGQCRVEPKVETASEEGQGMAWRSGGIARGGAAEVAKLDGRPVYGGTPADGSVIEAITALRAGGQSVMFYPFLLMDQLAQNGRPDPWTGADDQPALPWRGRITLSQAPGRAGSPYGTAAADAEVAAFFGTAQVSDFSLSGGTVSYSGPAEWSYRRFILHYAHLCAAAGGVDAFCVGSELRGLTQAEGAGGAFPAVAALRQLAADVKAILPAARVGYAADWSEYAGYQTPGGDLRFPLDPLWADPAVDFIGIDNYLPLSDWRDGTDHADAGWGSIYRLDYLQANIEGGEYYDWYYAAPEHREAQIRTPIRDGEHGEPWVWRSKDIRGWWMNAHHERIGGVRQAAPTPWVPQSKPVWFTEYGCAAIDKGTNEPNRFLDPKSSESAVPHHSDGRRDDLIQMQYLRAMQGYWSDPARNPQSAVYGGPMIDMARAHVWAWDARPFPQFPGNVALWSDGANYGRGHWLSGRASAQPLGRVVAEICERSGVVDHDVSGLHGLLRGYAVAEVESARSALQPLMLAYGFDAAERDGRLVFRMRDGIARAEIPAERLAVTEDSDGLVETVRAPEAELAGRVRLSYVEAEGDYEARAAEAIFPDETLRGASQSEVALALTGAEGQRVVERWLAEARVARDGARFALPPSLAHLGAGDVVRVNGRDYRLDRIEQAGALSVEASRVEPGLYRPSDESEVRVIPRPFAAPVPVFPLFLDLPLMSGEEAPQAPHLAVAATPWPGSVALFGSDQDAGYGLRMTLARGATLGVLQSPAGPARSGLWDRGTVLRLRVSGGTLGSAAPEQVLNGANLVALGDGTPGNWELIQFATANLVGPATYELSMLLRGQAGTEAAGAGGWMPGAYAVLMNGAPVQVPLALSERDLARHWRIGPAARSYDDPSYVHRVDAFAGVGLRPLSPAHLRAVRTASGDLVVGWIRRTRIGGDSWSAGDVPLGEASERYRIRVVTAAGTRREIMTGLPAWTYTAAEQAGDGVVAPFEIGVAQVSEVFGPGVETRITVDV